MDVFDIRVLGFEEHVTDPVAAIARAFDIDTVMAEKVVERAPVVVRRGVDEATAERFFNALRRVGARVKLEKRVQPTRPPPAASSPPPAAPPSLAQPAPPILPAPDGGFGTHDSLPVPDLDATLIDPAPGPSAHHGPGASVPADPALAPVDIRPAPASAPPDGPGGFVPRDRMAPELHHPEEGAVQEPFMGRLFGAFTYPFQKSGLAIFAGIALAAAVLGIIPFIGGFLAAGVQAIFFFRVIQHSGDGEDDLPQPADFTELSDFLVPSIRFAIAILVPFVPALSAGYILGLDSPALLPVAALLALFGLAYMPASMMVASLTGGCLGPLNPVAGLMIMTRVPGAYAITTVLVGLVVILDVIVMTGVYTVTNLIPVPFLPGLVQSTVGLILPTVACRMLGLFLHQYRHELGHGLGD